MKITVIVPVRNSVHTIQRTLDSIFEQTYRNLELLVMDGNSTDGTLDCIRANANRITYWQSEPDRASTEAINKGLRLATGDVILIMGADDAMASPTVLADAVRLFETDPSIDMVAGAIRAIDSTGLVPTRCSQSDPSQLHWRTSVHLGCTLFRRELFAERQFDLRMKVGDDYEFISYLLREKKAKLKICQIIFVDFAINGHSNRVENDFLAVWDGLYVRRTYFGWGAASICFARDFSIACLRRLRIRPFTWARKAQRLLRTLWLRDA